MKCRNCGAEIPEDQLICPRCGHEIQIVPDYNPLDDVLAAQVKGEVTRTMTVNLSDVEGMDQITRRYDSDMSKKANRSTASMRGSNTSRNGSESRGTASSRNANSPRGNASSRGNTNDRQAQMERRRRAERKRQLQKKKKQRMIIIIAALVILFIVAAIFGYKNSYAGKLDQGIKYYKAENYTEAEEVLKVAIKKDKEKPDAYTALADVYIATDELNKAEELFLSAIAKQNNNTALYQAVIDFYIKTEQQYKVSELFDNCSNDRIIEKLSVYFSEKPEFSLDPKKDYDEIQGLELTTKEKEIYYTTDGSDPVTAGSLYKEPIKLDEGDTVVKAVSVNEKGIPSLPVEKTYHIQFPIADAPTVSPITGQYDKAQQITINVPEGYIAYYSMDGSEPSPDGSGSYQYSEPVNMPEGSTIFSAVLVDKNNRLSDVTKRNYELVLSEE